MWRNVTLWREQTDDNTSTPTSMILLCLITLITPSLWPAFATYVPTEQTLTNFPVYQLFERQEACVNPCGPYGQLCCDSDQVCYTDSSGNGQCSRTSATSAALSTSATTSIEGTNPSTSAATYTVITVTPSSDSTTLPLLPLLPLPRRPCLRQHLLNLLPTTPTWKAMTIG
jgi:hypothetical protein